MKKMCHTPHFPFLIGLALLMCSCEKVLDIDDSGAHDKMVVNAVPMAGHRASLWLSHTHFFLDSVAGHPVANATVSLLINGIPSTNDSTSRCNYFFADTLRPLDSLSLFIATPEGNLSASTYIPPLPKASNVRVAEWASPSFNLFVIPFDLSDSTGFAEYYSLTVTLRDSGLRYEPWQDRYRTIDTVSHTYFILNANGEITSNEVSPNIPLGGYLYSNLMFTDKLIDGRENYPVNLFVPIYTDTNEVSDSVHLFKHWYTVTLESITPARMRYLISVAQANSMTAFFAEQQQPFTNIQGGGLGIFAGASRWSHTFDPDTVQHFDMPDIPIMIPSPPSNRLSSSR